MPTPPDFTNGTALDASSLNSVGLWLVKTQTIGTAVPSVTVTNAFSADYNNYLITVNGGVGSTPAAAALQLTGSTTGYYSAWNGVFYTTAASNDGADNNAASWTAGAQYPEGNGMNAILFNPFLASSRTGIYFNRVDFRVGGSSGVGSGFHNVTASYTGFSIISGAGTMTGGTIRVYGYRN